MLRRKLVEARGKMGLTQAQIAEKIGISRSFYGLIENGLRNPTYGIALKTAQILKVSVEAIFFDLNGFRMKQENDNARQVG